ncbi:ATPase [Donghicola sp. C2-DW-16]|uniref:ATPase n=1 Tax=Donghicola mangrovi TaxID=2729614 RepID=A0ABX2PFX8_9RHOB|nr:ATPase [Donghicola mangrovi]NVO27831.1 ATPase [Donghicola mangrovi]
MLYPTADSWLNAQSKRITLFGMSGLGKTFLANMLRHESGWFHYSIDYRIGTRYMGEFITDDYKRIAMQHPMLRELLMSDSIYIGSNITFENLAPLSTYLGKPGNADQGGLPFAEYRRRQDQHRTAEIAALLDTTYFSQRAKGLYGYDNFICDSGGSICEVVDPNDPNDPVMKALSEETLLIWIEGSDAHTAELCRRFDRAPKPMYYMPEFLTAKWAEYLEINNQTPEQVNPDAFVRWTYAQALAHRQPRYAAMAKWGVTIKAEEVMQVKTPADFDALIAKAIQRQA